MLLYISYFGTQKLNSLENVAFVLISFFIYDFDNVCTHNIAYIASWKKCIFMILGTKKYSSNIATFGFIFTTVTVHRTSHYMRNTRREMIHYFVV